MDGRENRDDHYEDEQQFAYENEQVQELVDVVCPLIEPAGKTPTVDVEQKILRPLRAGGTAEEIQDLELLCSVLSLVLDRVGTAVLEALAEYVSRSNGQVTMVNFAASVDCVAGVLVDCEKLSYMQALYRHVREELYREQW